MRGFPTAAIVVVAAFPNLAFFSSFLVQSSYAQIATNTFTDDTGFTVDLPPGWIANDYQNTEPKQLLLRTN